MSEPWQFSLRTLFLVVLCCAVVFGVLAGGSEAGILIVIVIVGAPFVLAHLGFALIGGRPYQPIVLGTLGGASLWALLVCFVLIITEVGSRQPLRPLTHLGVTMVGGLLGLLFGVLVHARITRGGPVAAHLSFLRWLRQRVRRLTFALVGAYLAAYVLGRFLEVSSWRDPSALAVRTTWQEKVHSYQIAGYGVDDNFLPTLTRGLPDGPSRVRLAFYQTQLTDDSIDVLVDVSNLESVDLRGTKVTREGVAQLRDALPDCRIRW